MPRVQRIVSLLSILALFAVVLVGAREAHGARLKELATVRGVTDNALVGYGLVVGLAGTGDTQQSVQVRKVLANLLARQFGTMVTPGDVRPKNVAVVMVTAKLPPFSRVGRAIDVTVSSTGDAKSIYGGTLIPTALKGGNGKTYAWATGPVSIGGFSASGSSGSSVTKNHPTVGQIPNGGKVAKELAFALDAQQPITLNLKEPDFTTAARAANAINQVLGARLASAADPGTVRVQVPASERDNLVGLIATIENVDVTPDRRARIVINERTGTIVMGAHVRLSPVAVSHGGLTVQISEQKAVSQPGAPFSDAGETVVSDLSEVQVTEEGGGLAMLDPGPTLGDVVHALNTLGVKPRDLVAILLSMQQAGAVQAEIEVQ